MVKRFKTSRLTASSAVRSDEKLALVTTAFESLYSGQFTLSTQLIKPKFNEELDRHFTNEKLFVLCFIFFP